MSSIKGRHLDTTMDIDRFVTDPNLLTELCRDVIARLDVAPQNPELMAEFFAMDAQLREIAKTIDRLEKLGVPIPDVLRAEKTRLAAAMSVHDASTKALEQLADSLGGALREIRASLQRRKPQPVPSTGTAERVNPERLPQSVLRNSIVQALQTLGGSAQKSRVLELMEAALQGKFSPADLVWLDSKNSYSWQSTAKYARDELVKEGIIRSDSSKGTWELSVEHPMLQGKAGVLSAISRSQHD